MAVKKPRTPQPPREAADAGAPVHFEEALERLETIVDELEGGELSLEDSLARYEEGIRLSRRLTHALDTAEKRIERLVEGGEGEGAGDGPGTEPLELDPKPAPKPGGPGAPGGGGEGELPF